MASTRLYFFLDANLIIAATDIANTGDASEATPLAANAVEKNDAHGPYLHIFLYYMGPNNALHRIVGTAREEKVEWGAVRAIPRLALKDNTLLAVCNNGGDSVKNTIYHVAYGQNTFSAHVDEERSDWFAPPKS